MITILQFEASYLKLIAHFTGSQFQEELSVAQKEFFDNAGTLDENKPNYELRMRQFYDWYFLTRSLRGHMQTPLHIAAQQRELRLTNEDLETIEILKKHQHSVYEFIKLKKDEIILKDLFKNEKISVTHDQHIFNFDEKEFFECRLVEIDGKKFFLKGFCFHPESAQKFIIDEIKTYRKNPDLNFSEMMMRLNKMRYKFEQYRHVKPEMIYTNQNKLGL